MASQSWGYETGSSRLETVSQGGHSATYSYDPNSIAKKIFIVADENGQTRYYDASSKCWKKIGLDLVENALAADAKGLEQFIAAQNGPSLREQILKDAFLSGDPSIGDWLLYQFFDKLNGAGTLDLASAYYHHDIFSQQSLSDEAATLYALWGGVQLGAASTELVDLGALAKGLFRPSSSAPGSIPASSHLVGTGDDLAKAIPWIKPQKGVYDILVHGSEDAFHVLHNGSWVQIDQRSLSTFMKANGYQGGPVRLLSCSSGACPTGVAKNLANKLGTKVTAPSDTLWIHSNGNLTIGPTATSNTGFWSTFTPGLQLDLPGVQ